MASNAPEGSENFEPSLAAILKPLLVRIAEATHAGECIILLRDPQTEMFQLVATTWDDDTGLGDVVRPDEDMVSRVALTRQPLIVNQYREWDGGSVEMITSDSRDALLCVPLEWHGRYLGGLVVSSMSTERQFTPADIPTLTLVSPIISALLARYTPRDFQPDFEARLHAEVDDEIRELREARQQMAEDADQLRSLLADMAAIQEDERSRIAGDLHDSTNQLIVGAIYEIQVAEQRLAGGRIDEAGESLETAKQLLRKIEADNRILISDLRPLMLTSRGLGATFQWYLRSFAEKYGFKHEIHVQGEPQRLDPQVEIAVFRIVQEALKNILEHAQAQIVQIHLSFQPGKVVVVVQDDGHGFDPQAPYSTDQPHFGLIGMRERALSIGAQVEVHSAPNEGTRLILHVPVLATPEDPLGRFEQRHSVQVALSQRGRYRKGAKR